MGQLATGCLHQRSPNFLTPMPAGNFICWGVILAVYRPWVKTTEIRPLKPNTDPMNATQVRAQGHW